MSSTGSRMQRVSKNRIRHGQRARRFIDRFSILFFMLTVLIGVAGLGTLLIDVVMDATPWLNWRFLSTYASRNPEQAGILAALAGSIWIVGMTAVFTIPVGVGTAIYLEEFASDNWVKRIVQLNVSNLAGVPSIIYGLLGLTVFVFFFAMGRSVVAGALTMSLLILPIVIIASQEAIRAVPKGYRDAAFALGATRWQVVKDVVIPQSVPGMMSGVILAMSRAIGESAPMLIISSLVFLTFVPTDPGDRFTVLPLQIYVWVAQPQTGFRGIAAAGIIVLVILLLVMNGLAIWIRSRQQKRAPE